MFVDGAADVIEEHDPGVVDQHVEGRVLNDEVRCNACDAGWIAYVQLDRDHAGIGVNRGS